MQPEPKEKTWGWMIAVVGGFMIGVTMAPLTMFAPLYMDIIGDRLETGGVETIVSAFFTLFCFTSSIGRLTQYYTLKANDQPARAIVASTLTKRFGSRTSALIAAFIYCAGNLSSAFCPSYIYLFICYSVVGFGSGSMFVVPALCLNDCFTRLRTVGFGLMHSVCISVGMLYPLLTKELMQNYGNSGARLILAAISANIIPAALLMRSKPTFKLSALKTVQIEKLLQEDVSPLIGQKQTRSDFDGESSGKLHKSIITSCRKYWKVIADSDPVYLLTQPDYIILILGVAIVTLFDSFFFALLPLFLMNVRSLTLDDTAYILVAVGAGDFAGRILLMVFGKFLANSNRIVCVSAIISSAGIILVVTFVANFWATAILCCALGLFRGLILVTVELVFAERYDKELYYAAMGTSGIVSGFVYLIMGYLFGLLSSSGGYVVKFTVIVGVMFGCSLVWLLDMSFNSCCRRRRCNIPSTRLRSRS